MLRFHLSTLLLGTVFAGSAISLYFPPPAWRPATREEAKECFRQFPSGFSNFSTMAIGTPARVSYDEEFDEEARYDHETRIWSIWLIGKTSHSRTLVFSQTLPRTVCSFAFSNDKRYLFIDNNEIQFYRRVSPYGWRALPRLPQFWLALILWVALSTVFARWMVKRSGVEP